MTQPTRTPRQSNVVIIAGFLALTACSKADDSAAVAANPSSTPAGMSKTVEEDLADIGRYELTMAKYDKYIAAQRNLALKMKSLSPAEREAIKARQEARDNSNANIDEMVKNFESEPAMVAAMREAGLSPREFAVMTMAIMTTGMAAGVAQMRPNDNQDSLIRAMNVNPANVKFLRENEAELTRKQKDLEAEMKRLGVDTDS